jgi:hypothetical protein
LIVYENFEQGSIEWFEARKGLPTTSEYSTIQASGKKGEPSKTRLTYLRKLAGEVVTGQLADPFTNRHTERGQQMEPRARAAYCFLYEPQDLSRVAFILREDLNTGGSPDALIGTDGALEIKTQLPHLLIATLHADQFPPEHMAQCQGLLWVTERKWIDICVYWPSMPMLVKRLWRNDDYIKELALAVAQFNDELAAEVDWVRRYGRRA